MAVIKCKMCGGDLDISEGLSVCECEYCGTKQTVPTADNEKKLTLFARANRLRIANEFDKAAGVYETVVADFPEEAEAYWGLVLCRYGIEYVDDPATGKKVPTCHRVSFDSVLEDSDFEQACENADAIARRQYREEAKQIEDIRRGIIEVSGKEDPYDIFICYKETDENGDRTIDSVIAQDVYDALTEKGYRVFFSRISLEDKLGTEYEPYIFAALNSAKVMLAFGTDYEYYNAVWVKNEWSRFLKLMEKDKSKHLIPCYKGIDAYDMPKEFHRLQGQDMGKVGAVQDLLRGVEKILPRKEAKSTPVFTGRSVSAGASYTDRGMLFLEDGDFARADEYFEKALDADPKYSSAYLGKFLAALRVATLEDAAKRAVKVEEFRDFSRARQFASPQEREQLEQAAEAMTKRSAIHDMIICLKRLMVKRILAERADQERRKLVEQKQRELQEIHEREIAEKELRMKREQTIAENRERAIRTAPVLKEARDWISPMQRLLAAGGDHTLGVQENGMVVATGAHYWGQCDVRAWENIIAVAAGSEFSIGLRSDGSVLATGRNNYQQCDVEEWKGVIAIATGSIHTVGLLSDGSVVATGAGIREQSNVSAWKRIIAIDAGNAHTVGLREDGTVVAIGHNSDGRCNVEDWRDIVAVAAGNSHTLGLRTDGLVVATGANREGQCDAEWWSDIIAVSAGGKHSVGLRADGTVLAVGRNAEGQCNVDSWKDIIAISAGDHHTVGVRADGSAVSTGIIVTDNNQDYGQSDVRNWKLMTLEAAERQEKQLREAKEQIEKREIEQREAIERAKQERKEAAERSERERREEAERIKTRRERKQQELTIEKEKLKTELANLKGLFTGKRRKEIEARLGEIDTELKKLQ